MIKKLCYELYKIDWKKGRVTPDMEADNIKEYFAVAGVIDIEEYSYEDYLGNFGYNGDLYSGFEEFCDNEYLDEEYMKELLGSETLIEKYLTDIRISSEESMLVLKTPRSCSGCELNCNSIGCSYTGTKFYDDDNFDPDTDVLGDCPLRPYKRKE